MRSQRLPTIARKSRRDRSGLLHPGLGVGHERQLQRGASRASRCRLAITASSVSKGAIRPADVLTVDADGAPVGRKAGRPSAETLLHVAVAQHARRRRGPAHALGVEHDAVGAARRGGRPDAARFRNAEGPRGRTDARAHGVGADLRQRPGHVGACRARRGDAEGSRPTSTASSCAATGCTLGATTWPRPGGTSRSSNSCSRRPGGCTRAAARQSGDSHGASQHS